MNHKRIRAFTLIELLVVISIISLLSSIVLASLNAARDKGRDAAIKSNLNSARTASYLFLSDVGSYSMICTNTAQQHYIGRYVAAAENVYRGSASAYADGTPSTWNTAQCHDAPASWVAWVPLRGSTASTPLAWCVDSEGTSKQTSTLLAGFAGVCP